MRVLHVVATAQRRGAEMFAADLVRALDSGIEQHVALLRSDRPELTYSAETTVLRSGWRVPAARVDLSLVRGLKRLIERWDPIAIQVHGGEPLKHALLATAGLSVRVVYRRIGAATQEMTRGARRAAHARLMRSADSVVAVANVLRDEAIATFGVDPERVVTIPNAVDPARLEARQDRASTRTELGIPAEARVVTSLGALTPEKDPVTHLEVVRRARQQAPDVVHLVVGDGPMRAAVERAAATTNGRGGRVVIVGSRSDVSELLAASDVLLVASRSEGLPGCVIEAGMVGVPTVAFNVGGVSDAVVDGVTGVLAPPRDVEALARGLARLVEEDELRRSMGEAARERCEAEFHIRDAADRYRRLYEAMVR